MAKLTGHLTKTTAPIKSLSNLHAMHHYFLSIAKAATTRSQQLIAYRNWLFFALGINLGYRGGDITELTWDKLVTYNPSSNTYSIRNDEYNYIHAEKTGKATIVHFNDESCRIINFYLKATGIKPIAGTPVFFSRKTAGTSEATVSGHIDCDNMGRILKKAAKACGIIGNICTHTLRKTFGYHYYKETGDIITLQKILGHSNPGITLTYIGITAEDIMAAYDRKPDTCIDDLDTYLPANSCAPVVAVIPSNVIPLRHTAVRQSTDQHHSNFYSPYRYTPQKGCESDVFHNTSFYRSMLNPQTAQLRNVPSGQWAGTCATD